MDENESEKIAKEYLNKLGWKPKRTQAYDYGTGFPDFMCSNGRFVEVKTTNASNGINISFKQFKKIKELNESNLETFLLLIAGDGIYLFSVKYYKREKMKIKLTKMQKKYNSLVGKKIKCPFCNYEWYTTSKLLYACCPSCIKKIKLKS